jgi:hypothetical protein
MSEHTALYLGLYFGNRGIAKSSWFKHALLYWDKLAVIRLRMVDEWRLNLNQEDELQNAGLLRVINPEEALKGNSEDLDRIFLQAVDALEPFAGPRGPGYDPEHWCVTQSDKSASHLFRELEVRRLVLRGEGGDPDSCLMDYRAAYWYDMYLTALMLAQENDLDPLARDQKALSDLTRPTVNITDAIQTLRCATIMDALPVPVNPVPIGQLIEFKRHHAIQLRELREYLSGKLAELALIDDESIRLTRAEIIKHEVRQDIMLLSQQMSKRYWPKIAFGGIAGIAASALATGAAAASGGATLPTGLGIAAGLTGIPPAIICAGEAFRTARSSKGSPVAYAALTGRL